MATTSIVSDITGRAVTPYLRYLFRIQAGIGATECTSLPLRNVATANTSHQRLAPHWYCSVKIQAYRLRSIVRIYIPVNIILKEMFYSTTLSSNLTHNKVQCSFLITARLT